MNEAMTPEQYEADLTAKLYPSMAKPESDTPRYIGPEKSGNEIKTEPKAKEDDKALGAAKPPLAPEAVKAAIEGVAKELGFDPSELPEGISEFVADKPEKLKGLVEMHNKQVTKMVETQSRQWREQSQAEFGTGPGGYADAKAALNRYGDDEFKQFLEQTHIGNHPVMIRFLSKVGKRG